MELEQQIIALLGPKFNPAAEAGDPGRQIEVGYNGRLKVAADHDGDFIIWDHQTDEPTFVFIPRDELVELIAALVTMAQEVALETE